MTDVNLDAPGPVIRYVNPAFTALTGYAPEEVVGRSPRFLQGPDTDRDAVAALRRDLMAGGPARATLLNRRKNGERYACSLLITPLIGRHGGTDHFVCIAHDEQERRHRESRRLSGEHEQTLTLVEDLEIRQGEADATIERQRAELALLNGRYEAALQRVDLLSEMLVLRERALDHHSAEHGRSTQELRATLEEMRAMDEEVRVTLAELEHANLALERSNAELRASQASNADKLRLLATASHDLRQPVMSLGLFLDVLRHRVGPGENKIMGGVMAAHLTIRTLLDGMLDAARLDAGVLQPDFGPVSMNAMLDGIRHEFVLQAEMRGLRFRIVPCSLQVHSDSQLLERILRNLIANALKYTERGGLVVGCRRQSGDRLRIEVWDSGPGIPKESQRRIFEEFQQLDNPDHDQKRGVGLGLSICQSASKNQPSSASNFQPRFQLQKPVVQGVHG
ncbi:PAS domain S-box-containing protein, partial [Azospirillum agricola]|uniref:receiver/sensor box histidine kinase n=1 Tax=Azospirillum agricola TaxID=1720247 RepID=UPI002D7EEC4A